MKAHVQFGLALALAISAVTAARPAAQTVGELRPIEMGGLARFGTAVALHGDVALVGAPGESARGAASGAVHVLRPVAGGWSDELLTAADTAWGDNFGASVAWDGERALVGAPRRAGGGGAYVFRLDGDVWVEEAFLPPRDVLVPVSPYDAKENGHGVAVALHGDTAAVFDRNSGMGTISVNAVLLYRRAGTTWTFEDQVSELVPGQPLKPSLALVEDTLFVAEGSGGAFAFSRDDAGTPAVEDDSWIFHAKLPVDTNFDPVSLSAEGDRLAVGLPYHPGTDLGGVCVFERDDAGTPADPLDDVWALQQAIASPSHPQSADGFGFAVALRGDVLVATSKNSQAVLGDPYAWHGAVDVLRFDGTSWQPEAHLVAPLPTKDSTKVFGSACALDGERAIVADAHTQELGPESGSVRVVEHAGGGAWSFTAQVLPAGLARVKCFGYSVDLSDGGDTAVVGAQLTATAGAEAGVTYVFEREQPGWLQSARLVPADLAAGDRFGSAVAVEGDHLIAGAHQRDAAYADQGAVYVYARSGSAWTQQAQLVAPDPWPQAYFGAAVALSGERALVGAHGDGALGAKAGAAYVFRRIGAQWELEATLHAPAAAAGDAFGKSVALVGDRALVGAPGADGGRGAGHVFARVGAAWVLEQTLVAPDGSPQDQLGFACALSGDRALLGAWRDDGLDQDSGSAYLFTRDPVLGLWSPEPKLAVPAPGYTGDSRYGAAVALEGERAIIGSPTRMYGSTGKAWRLEGSAGLGGPWIEVEQVELADSTLGYQTAFGLQVALSGPVAAIGAPMVVPPASLDVPHEFDAAGSVVLVSSETPALVGTPMKIDDVGGVQTLLLDAPAEQAGRSYLVLGTKSGIYPGLTVGGWTLPLQPDSYFFLVLNQPDQGPASGFLGVLDADGDAQAHVIVPPLPPLSTYTVHHAFAVFDIAIGAITFVSNPATLYIDFYDGSQG